MQIEISSETRTTGIPSTVERLLDGQATIEPETREFYIDVLEADADNDGGDLALALGISAVGIALFAIALTAPVGGIWAAGLASLTTVGALLLAIWSRRKAEKRLRVLIRLYDMRREAVVRGARRKWWRRR